MITSTKNEFIKQVKKLDKNSDLFIVEGLNAVSEIKSPFTISKLIVTEAFENYDTNAETIVVSSEVYKSISDTKSPQGIMAICEKVIYDENLIFAKAPKLLLLENLSDPGNLGSIIRSAVAFSFDAIVLTNNCVSVYNEKVIRSSVGNIFNIPFIINQDLEATMQKMHKLNIETIALSLKGEYLQQKQYKNGFCLLIGNEANGLTQEAHDLSKSLIKIPMNEACESLNASVAASIIMYEMAKG